MAILVDEDDDYLHLRTPGGTVIPFPRAALSDETVAALRQPPQPEPALDPAFADSLSDVDTAMTPQQRLAAAIQMRGQRLNQPLAKPNQAPTYGALATRAEDQARQEKDIAALSAETQAEEDRKKSALNAQGERDITDLRKKTSEKQARSQDKLDELGRQADAHWKAIEDFRLDPDRLWNSKDDSQKLTTALGIALGGLAQASATKAAWMVGNPGAAPKSNVGWDIFQTAIERDIEAQRADYQRLMAVGQHADNAWGRLYNVFQDEKAADRALEVQLLDDLKRKKDNLLDEGAPARAKLAGQLLELKIDEAKTRAQKELKDSQDASAARWAGIKEQKRAHDMDLMKNLAEIEARKAASKAAQGQRQIYGVGGQALDDGKKPVISANEKQAEKLTAANETYANLSRGIAELIRSYEEFGYENPYSDERARRQSLQKDLVTQMKELDKLGALSGPDMGLETGKLGTGDEFWTGNVIAKLKETQRLLDRKLKNTYDAHGYDGQAILGKLRPVQFTPDGQGPAEKTDDELLNSPEAAPFRVPRR